MVLVMRRKGNDTGSSLEDMHAKRTTIPPRRTSRILCGVWTSGAPQPAQVTMGATLAIGLAKIAETSALKPPPQNRGKGNRNRS